MTAKIQGTLEDLAKALRENAKTGEKYKKVQLIYADNGVGKTRLSMAFRDLGREKNKKGETINHDTLYYNAYTEDLFRWNNNFSHEQEKPPVLELNLESRFFNGLRVESKSEDKSETSRRAIKRALMKIEKRSLIKSIRKTAGKTIRKALIKAEKRVLIKAFEKRIRRFLNCYASFRFKIDYKNGKLGEVRFFYDNAKDSVKISRGEERIFVWCFFLAIMEMAIKRDAAYKWVNYIYIDDPISSLDDNNAISVAYDLKGTLKREKVLEKKNKPKFVISTHHALFFDVLCNEFFRDHDLKKLKKHIEKYQLVKDKDIHELKPLKQEKPFFQHLEVLEMLYQAQKDGTLRRYHFNMLRSVLETISSFFGQKDFVYFIDEDNRERCARVINLRSHADVALFDLSELKNEEREIFNIVLKALGGMDFKI